MRYVQTVVSSLRGFRVAGPATLALLLSIGRSASANWTSGTQYAELVGNPAGNFGFSSSGVYAIGNAAAEFSQCDADIKRDYTWSGGGTTTATVYFDTSAGADKTSGPGSGSAVGEAKYDQTAQSYANYPGGPTSDSDNWQMTITGTTTLSGRCNSTATSVEGATLEASANLTWGTPQ